MQPGQRIGSYQLERTLGQGGMGAVYLARDPHGRHVALKVLHTYDPELLARFQREGRVLQSLSTPGVVRLLEFGTHERRPFLVQEFCAGGDVAGLLRERGRLEPDHARELIREVAAALEVVHQAGIVHRDLKPANLLLADGRPKVTDFGLARAKGVDARSLTETGTLLGTPAYMAPEQLEDARAVDARTDVYALGVILYELLSGSRPFQGPTALAVASAVLDGHPPPLPAEIPADLQEVVRCAMQLSPADRYSSAGLLAEALRPSPPEQPTQSRVVWVAGLGVALVALVMAAALAHSADPAPAEPSSAETPQSSGPTTRLVTPSPALPNPTPLATQPAPEPHPAPVGPAFVRALAKCLDDPEQAVRELEALADSGHAGAGAALIRLLLTRPETQARAEELVRSQPQGPERVLLRACLAARAQTSPYSLPALRSLQGPALASDQSAREIFDLAAVDTQFERALTQLNVSVREREIDPLYKALLGRRPAWASDWLTLYRRTPVFSRLRTLTLEKIRALSHAGRRRFLLARLQLEFPLDAALFHPENEAPRQLLLEAAQDGYLPAAAELGRRLAEGRLPGSTEEVQRWLTVAAFGGVPESANLLLLHTPKRAIVAMGTLLRAPEAIYATGKKLLPRNRTRAIQLWRVAAAHGHAKSSLALGDALRAKPKQSERYYRIAARDGGFLYLEAFAKSPGDRPEKLSLLAGLAYAGRVEAARAVAVTLEKNGKPQQARAFYRRAYEGSEPGPDREAIAASLRRLAPPPGGPVAQAGQLELLELAQGGDVEAIKELGRRAHLECSGKLRLPRLEAAGVAGEADCLVYAARTFQTRDTAKGRALCARAVMAGRTDLLMVLNREQELFQRAEQGDPWAAYGKAQALISRGRTLDALEPLRFAAGRGLEPAQRLLLELELAAHHRKGSTPPTALVKRARAKPAVLGGAALRENPPAYEQARRFLLPAALRGDVTRRDLFLLGQAIAKGPGSANEAMAQPWYQAAAELGQPRAAVARIAYLLGKPHQSKLWQEGWSRCLQLLEALGDATPSAAWRTFGEAAIRTPRPQREAAIAVLEPIPRTRDTTWASAKLYLSLGDVERAAELLADIKPGPLALVNQFRRAEGVLRSAAEESSEASLAALLSSETPSSRHLLAQHLLVDAILGVEHPGEPSLVDCLDPLLSSPKFRHRARELQGYHRELLR